MKIAITGGIGSGKSVASRIMKMMGVPVYDCDSRAKILMESDSLIRQGLQRMFGEECYTPDGRLDRKWLASRIFVDKDALRRVNALVHPRVKADFLSWADERSESIVAVETAILFESDMRDAVDKVLLVWADTDTCIKRVEGRNGMTRTQVVSRMNNQMPLDELLLLCDYAVRNDTGAPLIPQLIEVLREVSTSSQQ